jgi:DNA-binding GntR family transcriptional regulator
VTSPDASELGSLRVGRVAAPLREQVVGVLREAILDFRLKPGQRLIERELMEQTGVSRTTIREVLRQLTAEGLVTTIPQRGAIVVELSGKEARDLYEVRATLEALTARLFAERGSDDDVRALRVAADELHDLGRTEPPAPIKDMLDAKDRYYDVFLAGAGNDAIGAILAGLQARVRVMRATSLSQPGRPAETVAEIEEVVRAIERRDPAGAAAAAERHVQHAAERGLRGLRARMDGGGDGRYAPADDAS